MIVEILYTIGGLVFLTFILIFINILQNGKIITNDDELPKIKEIIGKEAENTDITDLQKLSKSDLMKVFLISPALQIGDLEGEYRAGNFNVGILAFFVNFFTNNLFGKGRWIGKGFQITEGAGHGYNIFKHKDGQNRHRKFKNFVGPSSIDNRESFHLVYRDFNKGIRVSSMHDEVRKVNKDLYVGMGSTGWGLGFKNPSPFYIIGPSTDTQNVNIED